METNSFILGASFKISLVCSLFESRTLRGFLFNLSRSSFSIEKLDLDRLNKNPLRVLDSKSEQTKDILKDAPKMNEFVSKESLDLLNLIKNSFSEHNIEIDYSLVRGLDYYTGFIFEAISDDLGAQDSYLGGGRYDLSLIHI